VLEKKNLLEKSENAILVGVIHNHQTEQQVTEYMDELAFLASTAGATTIKKVVQRLKHPDSRTYIGKGKLEEIKKYAQGKNVGLLIFDDELSGSQIGNIEEAVGIKTIDRSDLILAQYQYILPRLRGMWKHLERLGGGIGTRGPGETEIETDRRIVREKISLLRRKLQEIEKQAFTQRKERGEFIRVALVGYTNVGKSTLMNLLSKSEVLAENKLFATLDTTTRKLVFENTPFLLSDTVGFIRKLPHHLIESFKSTLDEVKESDILMHVVDISHPQYEDQMKVVNATLAELGCADKPTITVFNKMDVYEKLNFDEWLEADIKETLLNDLKKRWETETSGNCVFISATERRDIDKLRTIMLTTIREIYLKRYPYKTSFQQFDYGA